MQLVYIQILQAPEAALDGLKMMMSLVGTYTLVKGSTPTKFDDWLWWINQLSIISRLNVHLELKSLTQSCITFDN